MALATNSNNNFNSNDINSNSNNNNNNTMQNNCTPASRQHVYGSLNNFHIEKQIGQGQFSQVFKAKCLVDNRVVALKRMKVNKSNRIEF
jgi:hypothetical protein